MNGSLAPGVLPGVLRVLYVGRRTGILHVSRGDERRSVRFRKGNIVRAETNVASERLGETLVELGELSREDLERATEVVARDKKKLGAVLQQLGVMTKEGLDEALASHVREMLRRLFTWKDGDFEFVEDTAEAHVEGDISMRLSTGEVILEAVAAIDDPEVIRRALGNTDRVLASSLDPMLRFQKITLTPADGFLLSRVDGTLSAHEVIELAPMPEEEAERSLFGLLSVGIIEYSQTARTPSRPDAATRPPVSMPRAAATPPQPEPQPPPPGPEPEPAARPRVEAAAAPPQPPPQPASPPPAAPRPPPGQPEADSAARRAEIESLYGGLKTLNHFEVLGLPRRSSEADVKAAYFRLARKFHPDTHSDPTLTQLEDKIEAIFIRIGEAYDVLRDREKRGDYESMLPRERREPGAAAAAEAPADDAAPADPAAAGAEDVTYEVAARVSKALKVAAKLYEAEKYYDAIQLLEEHVPLAETPKMRHKLRILLARCKARNPNWGKDAEEQLRAVIEEDPDHVDAYFTLGKLYEEKKLKARAASMFRKVLTLRPDHEGARAAIGPVEPPVEQEAKGGGLLKKLFGKE